MARRLLLLGVRPGTAADAVDGHPAILTCQWPWLPQFISKSERRTLSLQELRNVRHVLRKAVSEKEVLQLVRAVAAVVALQTAVAAAVPQAHGVTGSTKVKDAPLAGVPASNDMELSKLCSISSEFADCAYIVPVCVCLGVHVWVPLWQAGYTWAKES